MSTAKLKISEGHAATSEAVETDKAANVGGDWYLVARYGSDNNANMTLPGIGELTIGRDPGNDIVIRDPSIGDSKCSLLLERPVVTVTLLEGSATCGGSVRSIGESWSLGSESLQLGQTSLSVSFSSGSESSDGSEQRAWQSVNGDSGQNQVSGSDEHRGEEDSTAASLHTGVRGISRRASARLAAVLVLLGIGVLSWQVVSSSRSEEPGAYALTTEFLNDSRFESVSTEVDNDTVRVTGSVQSNEDKIAIDQFLATLNDRYKSDIRVIDSLLAQVEDIFRVNGIIATAAMDKNGLLRVATGVAGDSELEQVRAMVATDIPQLIDWTIDNTPPEVIPPRVPEDPGKRVAMVVSDVPAYVLTADQTRYFVGSILPTGHRVTEIVEGRVTLTKNGVRSELKF